MLSWLTFSTSSSSSSSSTTAVAVAARMCYVIASSPTAGIHNRTCDLVFCMYPSSLFSSFLFSSLLFSSSPAIPCRTPPEYPLPYPRPLHRSGVTCDADRRKGMGRGVEREGGGEGGGEKGEKGWFKRVNTSQLRSRRTLLGHWSDRDASHPSSRSATPGVLSLTFCLRFESL